jgi:class 3 adenylate cyclase
MNGNAHSFLFADMVGFTALTAARGDETAAELAVGFADSVRALAAEHGVEFVKAMGDAVMVRGDAAQIVALGLRLVQDGPAPAGRPPVRIGVHTGTAVSRDGDWYGTTVNVAARLAACANGGELLLTEDTGRHMRRHLPLELIDQGLRRLRDVPSPVRVFAAHPAAIDSPALPAVAAAA